MTVTKPTSIVPGQAYDQSLANKYYGFFANEDTYVAGLCWYDLTTQDKIVFQKFRANYNFLNQANIAGILLANNATTQTMLTANNTPTDALVPVLRNTQFSVVPLSQLQQLGYIVLAGDGSGVVKVGDMLYKKIPTVNDTPLDLITYYSFAQGTTVDYTQYVPLGVRISQNNLTLNTPELYPNRVLCIGQSPNIIQPTPAPAIAHMQPDSNKDVTILRDEFAQLQTQLAESQLAQTAQHQTVVSSLQNRIQNLEAELNKSKATENIPHVADSEKTDNKQKGSNK